MDPTRNSYRHFGVTQNMGIPMRQSNQPLQPYTTSSSKIRYPLVAPMQVAHPPQHSRLPPWSKLSSDRDQMLGIGQMSPILGGTPHIRNVPLHPTGPSLMPKVSQNSTSVKVVDNFLKLNPNDSRIKEIEMLRIMKKNLDEASAMTKTSFTGKQNTYGVDEINTNSISSLPLLGNANPLVDQNKVQVEIDRLKEMASSVGFRGFDSPKTVQSKAPPWSTSSAFLNPGGINNDSERVKGQLAQQRMLPTSVHSFRGGERTDGKHLLSQEKSLDDITKRKKAIELEVEELKLKQRVRELEKERNRLLKQQQEEEVAEAPLKPTRSSLNFSLGSFMKNIPKPEVNQNEHEEQLRIRGELEKLKAEQTEKELELNRKIDALTQKLETKESGKKEGLEAKEVSRASTRFTDNVKNKVDQGQLAQKRKEDFPESLEYQINPKKVKNEENTTEGEQKTICVRNLPPSLSFATLRCIFKIGDIEGCEMPNTGEEPVYYITFSNEKDAKIVAQLSLINKSMYSYQGRELDISLEAPKTPQQTTFKIRIDGISNPNPTMDEPLWEHFKRYGNLLTFKLVIKEEEFGKPARDAYAVAEYVDSFDLEKALGKNWQEKQVFFEQKALRLQPCGEDGPYRSKKIAVDGIMYTPTTPLRMRSIFSSFGKILNIKSVPRLAPATSFSFVEFASEDCVEEVMKVCRNGGQMLMDGGIVFVSKVFSVTETESSTHKVTASGDQRELTEHEKEKMFAEKYKTKVMKIWDYATNCTSEDVFQVLLEYGDVHYVCFKNINGQETMFVVFEKFTVVDRVMKKLSHTQVLVSRGIAFQVALVHDTHNLQMDPNSIVIRMQRFYKPSTHYTLQNLFKRFGKVDHLLFKASLKADQCYGFVVFEKKALDRFWSQRKKDGTITIDGTTFTAVRTKEIANVAKRDPTFSNKIRILNLPNGVTYSELHSFMSRFGEVTGWKNQPDNCIVSFRKTSDAQYVLSKQPYELIFKGTNLILLSVRSEKEDSKQSLTKLQQAIHKNQVRAKLFIAAKVPPPLGLNPPPTSNKKKKKKKSKWSSPAPKIKIPEVVQYPLPNTQRFTNPNIASAPPLKQRPPPPPQAPPPSVVPHQAPPPHDAPPYQAHPPKGQLKPVPLMDINIGSRMTQPSMPQRESISARNFGPAETSKPARPEAQVHVSGFEGIKLTKTELTKYFSAFGSVEMIDFPVHQMNLQNSYCIVTFKTPEEANDLVAEWPEGLVLKEKAILLTKVDNFRSANFGAGAMTQMMPQQGNNPVMNYPAPPRNVQPFMQPLGSNPRMDFLAPPGTISPFMQPQLLMQTPQWGGQNPQF